MSIRFVLPSALLAVIILASAGPAAAQTEQPSRVAAVLRSVVRDPVVYVPAAAKYTSLRLDWGSSQVFFVHGFLEKNARYTISGRSNDIALSREAGNRRIVGDTLVVLSQSLSLGLAERAVERMLSSRFEGHQRLVAVIGRVVRIAGAASLTYNSSAPHFRQWQRNQRLAQEMGFK